jgi:hypothetical protein
MKGCLGLVVGVIVLVAVVGAASSGSSSSTATTSSSPSPTVVKVASRPDPMRHCDPNVTASVHTSCGFAERTFVAYAQAHEQDETELAQSIRPISPVTGKSYVMECGESREVAEQSFIACKGGASAKVEFPLKAIIAYEPARTPEPTPEEPKASEGEDEVGSPNHGTDAEFCEEHTCEGDFTTEPGTIVECTDGDYSHAGGIYGACSYHGGEAGGGGGQYEEEEG